LQSIAHNSLAPDKKDTAVFRKTDLFYAETEAFQLEPIYPCSRGWKSHEGSDKGNLSYASCIWINSSA
jgi:hypothetical protein